MFSTILKEITGYFDRDALISAFFPSLVFWGATLCLVMDRRVGWKASLNHWEALPVTAQFILLLGFFVWITFFAFLTINFQSALIRLYEGYWPENTSWMGRLWIKKRQTYQTRWDELQDQDQQLEQQQAKAILLQRQLDAMITDLSALIQSPPTRPLVPIDQAEVSLHEGITQLTEGITPSAGSRIESSVIEQLHQQWQDWAAGQVLAQTPTEKGRWQGFEQTLNQLTQEITQRITHQLGEVEEKRHQLNRNQFLFLPPHRDDVMPTQLGNIMKASELYSQERYNLDAILIWSRLQTVIPSEFAKTLQSAKTSLDLMVTLSAFCLIFGFPLSAWLSLRADQWFLFIVPLGFSALAFLMQQRGIGFAALIATGLGGLLSIDPESQVQPIIRLQVLLTLLSAILFVSRLSYQSALQAALNYGEQLKTAFDLFRWKALEALNLKLPNDLTEEKQLWGDICGLLYRGYGDQLTHYQYQLPLNANSLKTAPQTAQVVVSTQSLKAYEQIESTQLKTINWPIDQVPVQAIDNINTVHDCCPIEPLASNTPICTHHLIEHALLNQRFIAGIPATPAMVLGGNLQTGDRVNLVLHTTDSDAQTIADVLILSINPIELSKPTHQPAKAFSFVMGVAIPETEMNKWKMHQPEGQVTILK